MHLPAVTCYIMAIIMTIIMTMTMAMTMTIIVIICSTKWEYLVDAVRYGMIRSVLELTKKLLLDHIFPRITEAMQNHEEGGTDDGVHQVVLPQGS